MFDLFKRKASADTVEKKPWTERLKDGLSRSREKLASCLCVDWVAMMPGASGPSSASPMAKRPA